ncbi:alpha/beta hydrolase [Nocardioides sp. SR21]|uniref:alpha/beta hydrolase n=1 Tax=Nocardioides sp. SR21 TaxID=2919501 RepID=UPI001FA96A00|nr:alpha/beta hydrolase [Nocardioides sp. SR21]
MTQTLNPPQRAHGVPAAIGTTLNATARVAPGLGGRLALELWRRPGKPVPVRDDEREVHDAARRDRIGPVVTYAWGDGRRPVLLVHGWGARASRFAAVVTALLDAGLSPVAYDAWGHGASPGAVGTILDHQAVIEEIARRHGPFEGVVAHSFGVPVSLYAVREGLAADRVVAISGMGDFGFLVDTFCATLGASPTVNRELRRAIERTWFAGDPSIWERFSVGRAPGRELLVIHDAGDRVVDRGQSDPILGAYGADATLLETTGLGHNRILRDPDVVAATVGFLDT